MKRMYAFTLQKFKHHYHNQMETQFTILVNFNYAMHFTQPTLQPNSKNYAWNSLASSQS